MAIALGNEIIEELAVGSQNVTALAQGDVAIWNDEPPGPTIDYLRFTALEDGTEVCLSTHSNSAPAVSLEYSKNGGSWSTYTVNTSIPIDTSEYVEFRAGENGNTHFAEGTENFNFFYGKGKYKASGNVATLLKQDGELSSFSKNDALRYLWFSDTALADATDVRYPPIATTPYTYVYGHMFFRCHLSAAPRVLAATAIGNNTYQSFFQECPNLSVLPQECGLTRFGLGPFYYYQPNSAQYLKKQVLKFTADLSAAPDQWTSAYCSKDFSNCTAVPTLASNNSSGGIGATAEYIIVPDALYEEWKTTTNWSASASKIIKHSDFYVA